MLRIVSSSKVSLSTTKVFSRLLTRNKSNRVDPKDLLKQYKKLSKVSVEIADVYFQDKVSILLREMKLLCKLLEKDKSEMELLGKLLEKDKSEMELLGKLLAEKDVRIKEKECQILAGQGLLTSRGVTEAKLKKCLIEMKILNLAKDTERDNMSNIITIMIKQEKFLPVTSKCYQLLEAARNCGCDLKSLYESLCNAIHGAPWHGPSIKIFSKALREEETCLLTFIAEDMSLAYDLQK